VIPPFKVIVVDAKDCVLLNKADNCCVNNVTDVL
jgi:hypothetical protein